MILFVCSFFFLSTRVCHFQIKSTTFRPESLCCCRFFTVASASSPSSEIHWSFGLCPQPDRCKPSQIYSQRIWHLPMLRSACSPFRFRLVTFHSTLFDFKQEGLSELPCQDAHQLARRRRGNVAHLTYFIFLSTNLVNHCSFTNRFSFKRQYCSDGIYLSSCVRSVRLCKR